MVVEATDARVGGELSENPLSNQSEAPCVAVAPEGSYEQADEEGRGGSGGGRGAVAWAVLMQIHNQAESRPSAAGALSLALSLYFIKWAFNGL